MRFYGVDLGAVDGVGTSLLAALMSELGTRLNEVPQDAAQPVLLICRTQNRSAQVAQALAQRGWTNVRYVVGGMSMWALQGLPMVAPGSPSTASCSRCSSRLLFRIFTA